MARRRIIEQPTSRLAIWSRRIAFFSLLTTVIAVIVGRSGAVEIVPALSTLGGALALAVIAILLAFAAAISIWRDGVGGIGQSVAGLMIGLMLIAYPLYVGVKAYKFPAIQDITTDPIDPPRFDAIARLRPRDANPVAYAGLYTAEQQRTAYSDIEPDLTNSSAEEAYNAAMQVIPKRRGQGGAPPPPQGTAPRDGMIEAIARTPILGFRDDVAVRVRPTQEGARIDIRSASRYGRHDLGGNAARVRTLIEDIDEVLATPAKGEKPEKPAAPAKAPPQPAPKGASAKR